MNHFQLDFDSRLRSWARLRQDLIDQDLQTICVEVDRWWQRAPLINHYLHYQDQDAWPAPWDLLDENVYCTLARALGICYTLILLGVSNGELAIATDQFGDEYFVVIVSSQDHGVKYILSYHPGTVLSNTLNDFRIKHATTFHNIRTKIYKTNNE